VDEVMYRVRGRREREAGKRHRRAVIHYWSFQGGVGTEFGPLKLGHKHLARYIRLCMADTEKRARERRRKSLNRTPLSA